MTDETIIRIIEASCDVLSDVPWHEECKHLLPSYNALLQAAKANHPEDPFLAVLSTLEADSGVNPKEMHILFTQVRIALESLRSEPDRNEGHGQSQNVSSAAEGGKPSRLNDIENRLAEVSAQMQGIAERMKQADLSADEMRQLADEMSELGQRQAELARERARLRDKEE